MRQQSSGLLQLRRGRSAQESVAIIVHLRAADSERGIDLETVSELSRVVDTSQMCAVCRGESIANRCTRSVGMRLAGLDNT